MWICRKCLSQVDDVLSICWQCGAGKDGKVDPIFEEESPQKGATLAPQPVSDDQCPHCGGAAELGTIYARDGSSLLYRPGPATWWDNFLTGWFGAGEQVAQRFDSAGTHIPCLRCPACRTIFFRY